MEELIGKRKWIEEWLEREKTQTCLKEKMEFQLFCALQSNHECHRFRACDDDGDEYPDIQGLSGIYLERDWHRAAELIRNGCSFDCINQSAGIGPFCWLLEFGINGKEPMAAQILNQLDQKTIIGRVCPFDIIIISPVLQKNAKKTQKK